MNKDQLAAILKDVATLAQSVGALQPDVVSVEDAAKAVVSAIASKLPAKDDGTAYTDEELHAMAMAAIVPFNDVINRDGGGSTV